MKLLLLLVALSQSVGVRPAPVAPNPCSVADVAGELRCARVEVPENPDHPLGRKISIHVLVLKSASVTPEADPVLVLQGGPGGSATAAAGLYARVMSRLRERRDIVLVDARGTGESNPLSCDLSEDPTALPSASVDWLPPASIQACRTRLETKADLTQYTTANIVKDLEAVRVGLGYERLNVFGYSWGTRVAQEYLRRHPTRVRTMILKGVVPPPLALPVTHAREGQRVLDTTIARCEADLSCRTAFPELRADVARILPRLRSMSGETIRNLLYSPESAARVPLILHRAASGDVRPLEDAVVAARRGFLAANAIGMFLSVSCTEDVPFLDAAQAAALADGTFLGDYRVRQQQQACELWPRGRAEADARTPVRSEAPALLISGAADPVTPPRFGDEVARSLSNARHVVVPNHGHPFGTLVECASRFMAAFVERGTARDLDLSCIDDIEPPPFVVSAAPSRTPPIHSPIAGTWRLVSASAWTADGRRIDSPFGPSPQGLLIYTPDARMTVIISHGGRKPLSGDRISAPVDERAEAFATFFAYAGRYSLAGDRAVHHVEVSSVENWVGTDLIRGVHLEADRLKLTTPPISVGGVTQVTELVWQRVH